MAPVIMFLKKSSWAEVCVLSTGQHKEILGQTLSSFGLKVDVDLDLMTINQQLDELTARIFSALGSKIAELSPDLVLSQGDTTTVMVTSIICFYRSVPFGHIEAGLRSKDKRHPFPEELNRIITGQSATLHFAPTKISQDNLLQEKIGEMSIKITGNTVIDALKFMSDNVSPYCTENGGPLLLLTAHRRENFGSPLRNICSAAKELHDKYPNLNIVYPVHPNPNVKPIVKSILGELPRVNLLEPLSYREMVALMLGASIVLTDSGGIQEEAPALAKPVLVLRDTTERPEAVMSGVVRIVGTSKENIVSEVSKLFDNKEHYDAMARGFSPYGDGNASERIVEGCRRYLMNLSFYEFSQSPSWNCQPSDESFF